MESSSFALLALAFLALQAFVKAAPRETLEQLVDDCIEAYPRQKSKALRCAIKLDDDDDEPCEEPVKLRTPRSPVRLNRRLVSPFCSAIDDDVDKVEECIAEATNIKSPFTRSGFKHLSVWTRRFLSEVSSDFDWCADLMDEAASRGGETEQLGVCEKKNVMVCMHKAIGEARLDDCVQEYEDEDLTQESLKLMARCIWGSRKSNNTSNDKFSPRIRDF